MFFRFTDIFTFVLEDDFDVLGIHLPPHGSRLDRDVSATTPDDGVSFGLQALSVFPNTSIFFCVISPKNILLAARRSVSPVFSQVQAYRDVLFS